MAKNGQTLKLEHHLFEPTTSTSLPDIVMLHGICAGAWVFFSWHSQGLRCLSERNILESEERYV